MKRVLVMGGSCFMGKKVVEMLSGYMYIILLVKSVNYAERT